MTPRQSIAQRAPKASALLLSIVLLPRALRQQQPSSTSRGSVKHTWYCNRSLFVVEELAGDNTFRRANYCCRLS